MKPTKQTVYLPAKVMNKGQKADLKSVVKGIPTPVIRGEEGYFFTTEQLNEYTANVIKQSLETAAEKGICYINGFIQHSDGRQETQCFLDKQSITNTFEETFNKLKV